MNRAYLLLLLFSILTSMVFAGCSGHINEKSAASHLRSIQAKIEHNPIIEQYMVEVAHQVNRNWKLESNSAPDPSQIASIAFKIEPDGSIDNIFFTDRSGNPALDNSAYMAIVKSNPATPFPHNISEGSIQMGLRFASDGVR